MKRFPILIALALVLSGCGFQLRNAVRLPADLGPVQVQSPDPYSALAETLRRNLERGDVVLAPDDARSGYSRLRLLAERWADTPISVDANGRAQEYALRYAVIFELVRADGSVVVPEQAIELQRVYFSRATDTMGDSERELLGRELRREMAAAIMRRMDTLLRSESAPAA